MSTAQDLIAAVTANPEEDGPRLAYAQYLRSWDPDLAAFIEAQIEEAKVRRARRDYPAPNKHPLLLKHEREWSRTIARYAREWKFDRGFVSSITIDPHVFLEYGEWLYLNAPIRSVDFIAPDDGPFPMAELAESPLLANLDAVGFLVPTLTDEDFITFAKSAHLGRLQWMSADKQRLGPAVYEAYAAAPLTRKCIVLGLSHKDFPGEEFGETDQVDWWGAWVMDWLEMKPEGRELERKYGYLPWLHKDNRANEFDAAYFVAQGILPVRPPGSPVT